MDKEITFRIPEKLFRLIEADAERQGLTLEEAAVRAITIHYADQEIRKERPNNITIPVSEETYALYQDLMGNDNGNQRSYLQNPAGSA